MDIFFQRHIYLKIFCILSTDLFIIIVSLPLAYLVRTEDLILYVRNFDLQIYLILIATYVVLFFLNNIHLESIRYFNRQSIINYFKVYIIIFLVFILYDFFSKNDYQVLRSIPIIFLFISFTFSITYRILLSRILNLSNRKLYKKENIIIYGANDQGIALSRFLEESQNLTTVNFIDDETSKRQINGIKIINFNEFEKKYKNNVFKIYLSDERGSDTYRHKLKKLNKYIDSVRVLSSNKGIQNNTFRKLELNDFFLRDEVKELSKEAKILHRNKIILITGAGGSIGGQLAEKVFFLEPKLIILIDFHEHSLVNISNRLKEKLKEFNRDVEIKSILLNLSDTQLLNKILTTYRIDYVYHCAAYKHVDVSEIDINFNVFVKNNFINTKNLILLCLKNKIPHFVLVSSDKAVYPSNIMGITKRLCEIYLLELSKRLKIQNYKIVRFGNVFRSSGSVIPYFENQILNNKELIVTDENVKRFFMSIDEAGLLILESVTIKNQNLLILEMGEQIKIIDIAKLLIQLNPDKNIKINITNLKKGEKIKEELSYTKLYQTSKKSINSSLELFSKETFKKIKFFSKYYLKTKIDQNKKLLDEIIKY